MCLWLAELDKSRLAEIVVKKFTKFFSATSASKLFSIELCERVTGSRKKTRCLSENNDVMKFGHYGV